MTARKDPKDLLDKGRPTKWKPEFNQMVINFFDRSATQLHDNKIIGNTFPTLERFAYSIDVNTDTLVEWAKPENETAYPGFSAVYRKAKALQKDILVSNGLAGLYNSNFAVFVAKNITDMRDVSRTEVTGAEGAPLSVNDLSSGKIEVLRKEYEDKLKQELMNKS